ncbi:hypothetical protein OIV83_004564 [Microbotryomycetes sp. JL201]|nr:hypothetical protein OIV83_004564 [Microbotryomycetes sp. JL201]
MKHALLIAGCVLAFNVAATPVQSNDSALKPWPAIPTQKSYSAPKRPQTFTPVSVTKGLTSEGSGASGHSMVFSAVGDIYTLDYGHNVAGKPTFEVESVDGYAQIEVKYTESYPGLLNERGDGPFLFSNALANSFRVETLNVTKSGWLTSSLIQGGQRWESVKRVKGSNLVIKSAGFQPSIAVQPLDTRPGFFASSDDTYTKIWQLGPRTMEHTCFPPGTQTSTWEISEQGAYIRGQKPATTTNVTNLEDYTLTFRAKIDYGGVGWRVDTEVDALQATGPWFVLTSEYPEGDFVNRDRDFLPPNTLVLGSGWGLQNQTSLPGFVVDRFPLDFNVTEKVWHTIDTKSAPGGLYTVSLNGKEIVAFNLTSYDFARTNPYIPGGWQRSFAFGGWNDELAMWPPAIFKAHTRCSPIVYNNSMTSQDVPTEYGVATNDQWITTDCGKRDRFEWLGDRLISAEAVAVSTAEWNCIKGANDHAFARQSMAGQIPSNTVFSPLNENGFLRTVSIDPVLVDYNFDMMSLIYNYWQRTGDDDYVKKSWPQMRSSMTYALASALDPTTFLYGKPFGKAGTPVISYKGNGMAPTGSMIISCERMAEMAEFVGESNLADLYRLTASKTRANADALLWNATAGIYNVASLPGQFELVDIPLVTLAKIGTPERRMTFMDKLDQLEMPSGYFNGSRFANDVTKNSNPYYSNPKQTARAERLLKAAWGPMVRQDRNYTGTLWEFISEDQSHPGLELFTGQSHFFGAGATSFLTDYALGVRHAAKGFTQWVFEPLPFNTTWIQGRVPTPYGNIAAAWGYNADGKLMMEVTAPKGTEGTVIPPVSGKFSVNGGKAQSGNIPVKGGKGTVLIKQI